MSNVGETKWRPISVVRAVQSGQFYVYTLSYPFTYEHSYHTKNSRVFYVGKGVHARIFWHGQEARGRCDCRKCQVIRWIWNDGNQVDLAIRLMTRNEEEAYTEENRLIKLIGYDQLVNRRASTYSPPKAKSIQREFNDDVIPNHEMMPYVCKSTVKRVLDGALFAGRMIK